jgi:hypothetical protein
VEPVGFGADDVDGTGVWLVGDDDVLGLLDVGGADDVAVDPDDPVAALGLELLLEQDSVSKPADPTRATKATNANPPRGPPVRVRSDAILCLLLRGHLVPDDT